MYYVCGCWEFFFFNFCGEVGFVKPLWVSLNGRLLDFGHVDSPDTNITDITTSKTALKNLKFDF